MGRANILTETRTEQLNSHTCLLDMTMMGTEGAASWRPFYEPCLFLSEIGAFSEVHVMPDKHPCCSVQYLLSLLSNLEKSLEILGEQIPSPKGIGKYTE